ncbi:MAG: GNAT family N-acetyltransferase [Desulfocurvibacter africanus]
MNTIGFLTGGPELLDTIEPLWRGLCEHHARVSPDFAVWFRNRDFADRKAEIFAQASSGMQVRLALAGSETVGYCVSTLSTDGTGEVDSIFVREDYRGMEIGERLMRDALDWLEAQGATSLLVAVVHGNDRALQWYRRLGFAPRIVKMVRLKEG